MAQYSGKDLFPKAPMTDDSEPTQSANTRAERQGEDSIEPAAPPRLLTISSTLPLPIRKTARTMYEVVRETWLTRKPLAPSAFVAASTTFLLAMGAMLFLTNTFHAASWMPASYSEVYQDGQIWRAWTTLFAHGDFGHLASNSLLFFVLGFFLYGYFGARLFPVAAFAWGGLINLIVLPTYEPDMHLIGASGVVYWMGGAWLALYFFLSRQKNFTQRWLRSLGVGILIFMPAETFEPKVSYRTHLVGFALGLIAGTIHYVWHRERFLKAEIKETIVEESEAGDELPPEDGFPTTPGSQV